MNEFRVEQQPVTPANFLICVHVCACACTSGLLCLLSASSKCVFSMLTCTCSRGDTLGPHTLYTRVGQSWEGRSSPPRLISVSVCRHLLRMCLRNRPVCSHVYIFNAAAAYLCRSANGKEGKEQRKGSK